MLLAIFGDLRQRYPGHRRYLTDTLAQSLGSEATMYILDETKQTEHKSLVERNVIMWFNTSRGRLFILLLQHQSYYWIYYSLVIITSKGVEKCKSIWTNYRWIIRQIFKALFQGESYSNLTLSFMIWGFSIFLYHPVYAAVTAGTKLAPVFNCSCIYCSTKSCISGAVRKLQLALKLVKGAAEILSVSSWGVKNLNIYWSSIDVVKSLT